jgi:hypothetical protein
MFENKISFNLNMRQKVLVVAVDVVVLAELCIAMAAAAAAPDNFTPVFMKTFFSWFLPTLALGLIGSRLLRDKTAKAGS